MRSVFSRLSNLDSAAHTFVLPHIPYLCPCKDRYKTHVYARSYFGDAFIYQKLSFIDVSINKIWMCGVHDLAYPWYSNYISRILNFLVGNRKIALFLHKNFFFPKVLKVFIFQITCNTLLIYFCLKNLIFFSRWWLKKKVWSDQIFYRYLTYF